MGDAFFTLYKFFFFYKVADFDLKSFVLSSDDSLIPIRVNHPFPPLNPGHTQHTYPFFYEYKFLNSLLIRGPPSDTHLLLVRV
jgi:hypothetical protein